jgi:hypothetical protein
MSMNNDHHNAKVKIDVSTHYLHCLDFTIVN